MLNSRKAKPNNTDIIMYNTMTITIEFSLKEILDKLENKVDNLSENVNLRGDVKALQTEVSGLDQRIGNQECYHRPSLSVS